MLPAKEAVINLATQNFENTKETWKEILNDDAEKIEHHLGDLADEYFSVRNELEEKRDREAGVTIQDYHSYVTIAWNKVVSDGLFE